MSTEIVLIVVFGAVMIAREAIHSLERWKWSRERENLEMMLKSESIVQYANAKQAIKQRRTRPQEQPAGSEDWKFQIGR